MKYSGATSLESVHARERAFHDAIAEGIDPASMPPRDDGGFGESLLSSLGRLEGARVLELGCGAGDLTAQLVDRGAEVTAVDLSERMIELGAARIRAFRPAATVRWLAATIEATGLDESAFDVVVGRWILHHADVRRAGDEIHRVLRPGGSRVLRESGHGPAGI
jgi:ubiquinone/menaquinone biosynthesis C-methylase UbiE